MFKWFELYSRWVPLWLSLTNDRYGDLGLCSWGFSF